MTGAPAFGLIKTFQQRFPNGIFPNRGALRLIGRDAPLASCTDSCADRIAIVPSAGGWQP